MRSFVIRLLLLSGATPRLVIMVCCFGIMLMGVCWFACSPLVWREWNGNCIRDLASRLCLLASFAVGCLLQTSGCVLETMGMSQWVKLRICAGTQGLSLCNLRASDLRTMSF